MVRNELNCVNRRAVWNFKDGNCSLSILNDLAENIERIAGKESSSNYFLCFIPASPRNKTLNRYSDLDRRSLRIIGVEAALSAITKGIGSNRFRVRKLFSSMA